MTLFEFLRRDIKRMITGIGRQNKGNIYPLVMGEIEKYIIQITLQETNYNYLITSKILGIGRSTLYRKIQLHRITQPIRPTETSDSTEIS